MGTCKEFYGIFSIHIMSHRELHWELQKVLIKNCWESHKELWRVDLGNRRETLQGDKQELWEIEGDARGEGWGAGPLSPEWMIRFGCVLERMVQSLGDVTSNTSGTIRSRSDRPVFWHDWPQWSRAFSIGPHWEIMPPDLLDISSLSALCCFRAGLSRHAKSELVEWTIMILV